MRFFKPKQTTNTTALETLIRAQRKELDQGFRKISLALADYNLSSLTDTADRLKRTAIQMQHFDLADALRELERLAAGQARPQELYEAMDPVIELLPLTRKAA